MPHTLPPKHLELKAALHEERHKMQEVQVPIVTVSATYRKELAKQYQTLVHSTQDVVYSRAHYSMAEAIRQQALLEKKTAHVVDPTNFVSDADWQKIEFTETIGHVMARNKLLKWVKDKIDRVVRNKLPISQAITEPLLYLTEKVHRPIISLHYEAGRILAHHHKKLLQVVTDPHVRPQYVYFANHNNVSYAVFNQSTQTHFLAMAQELGISIAANRVIITGPPIDPRITAIGRNSTVRSFSEGGPINLAVTTGGLGTNLSEIKQVLDQLAPLLNPPEKIRLFLHAGTHRDFRNFFEDFAAQHNIRIGNLDDTTARIRVLHEDSIIDANENLIKYMFPWAHGVITKPSGDMAYDAAAAGCFLLFLHPWGEWEDNIQKIFIENGVGFDFNVDQAHQHFTTLLSKGSLIHAMKSAQNLPDLYRHGSQNILTAAQEI